MTYEEAFKLAIKEKTEGITKEEKDDLERFHMMFCCMDRRVFDDIVDSRIKEKQNNTENRP